MKFEEKNIIIDNVLTQSEIEEIYASIQDPIHHYTTDRFFQTISDFKLSKTVSEKIIKYCESISGENNLEIREHQFARYQKLIKQDGSVGNPQVNPHWDEPFNQPRFTFDLQLKSNISWPLVVESKRFILKDNQALTFSGTHQIHWRDRYSFKDGEFVDMLFVHLAKKYSEDMLPSIRKIMKSKVETYKKIYALE